MKILSCYIAGFGRFVNQSFDLSQALVVVKRDNGWGKTTLADFIRCMLFGMDAGRGKAIADNERARYEPWQGGTYGGTLTFVCGGRTYRVERTFGKTPAYDVARVYDENNMQSFAFGDKAERLGEILFGLNADSYRKSVYIPQGEIETGGLPDDFKTRLLSLLSTGGREEASAERAIRKLDEADRALRAKRRPAKGKLDEIDERLTLLARKKAECAEYAAQAKALRGGLAQAEGEIAACTKKINELTAAIEQASRKNERIALRQNARELQSRVSAARAELSALAVFFGENDPATINVDGLQTAVSEFYGLKTRLRDTEEKIAGLQAQARAYSELKTKAEACEKVLDSYDAVLERSGKTKGAGTRRTKPKSRLSPKANKTVVSVLIVSVLAAVVGGITAEKLPAVGLPVLGVAVLSMIICFLLILPRREKPSKELKRADEMQDEIDVRYDEVYAELASLRKQMSAYPEDIERVYANLGAERETLQKTVAGKERGICDFLQNFRFAEIYDYRAALAQLQEKIAAYAAARETLTAYESKLNQLPPDLLADGGDMQPIDDLSALKAQKAAWEGKKEELLSERAKTLVKAQQLEENADIGGLQAEEQTISAEKNRLEKRHGAILAAKRFLLKAKENMAARYLEPVERGCRYYLSILGGKETLRFAADGSPFCEENGRFRELDYYSAGSRELVGFCTRIALVDAVFAKEKPTLLLDDPFVNLDDEKTDKAKRLLKELSKRYQIIYFTCKKERTL